MQPLTTQGKELSGAVSTLNSASDVNTTGAVSGRPSHTYMLNVSSACAPLPLQKLSNRKTEAQVARHPQVECLALAMTQAGTAQRNAYLPMKRLTATIVSVEGPTPPACLQEGRGGPEVDAERVQVLPHRQRRQLARARLRYLFVAGAAH